MTKPIQVREVDLGSPAPPSPFPPRKGNYRSRDLDRGQSPRHPWTTSSRPPSARPVTDEILPGMSETISGCERGEESPGRGCDTRPARQRAPRNLLQSSASASNAPSDNPPPAAEARPRQEDFFPAPFRLPSKRLEPPEAPEKGALPLLSLFFRPRWEEEGEGLVEAYCCDHGTTGETPPGSAEEADDDSAWMVQPKICEESSRDAISAEQERWSTPHASWPGQNQAKEWEKCQKTREGQHNAHVRPLQQ